MPEFNLNVPVDLSERASDKLDLVKKIVHLITVATTLLTICVVAPLVATEARYLVSETCKIGKKKINNAL